MNELLSRLLQKCEVDLATGCWMWTGRRNHGGYGTWTLSVGGKTKTYRAHRLSYELHAEEIPHGMFICHRCDTPACINPDHLFIGTPKDNVADMDAKGRGRREPPRKLTDEQVAHIRRREMTAAQYAKLYGVHRGHIGNLWAGNYRKAA